MKNAKQEHFELDQEWVELMVEAKEANISPRNTKIFTFKQKVCSSWSGSQKSYRKSFLNVL